MDKVTRVFAFIYCGLILCLSSSAQVTFQKYLYNGGKWDEAYSVQQTSDSGYIVLGRDSGGIVKPDVYLNKLNINGDLEWSKTYGDYAGQTGY